MSTVPLDGIVKRAKAKLEILRGFYLNEPVKLSSQRPLHTGVQCLSGQLLVLDKAELGGKGAYKLATKALLDSNGFAHLTKADWNDRDVIASGVVNGLSMTDDFEFQTAYYDAATYALHDEITASDVTPGSFKKAAAGDKVIGRVSRIGGEANGTTNQKGFISGVEDAGLLLLTVECGFTPYVKA